MGYLTAETLFSFLWWWCGGCNTKEKVSKKVVWISSWAIKILSCCNSFCWGSAHDLHSRGRCYSSWFHICSRLQICTPYVLQSYPSVSMWCIIKPVSGYKNAGISEYTAMTSLWKQSFLALTVAWVPQSIQVVPVSKIQVKHLKTASLQGREKPKLPKQS